MKKFTKISNKLYGTQDVDFNKLNISNDIYQNNINILKVSAIMMMIIFFIMFLSSFFVPNYADKRLFYGFETFATFAVALTSRLLLKKCQSYVLLFVYFFNTLLHYYGIYVGVLSQQNNLAVTNCLFLAVLPLLFVDDALNIILYTTAAAVINVITMLMLKSNFSGLIVDLTDILFSWIMGIALGVEINRIKVKSYLREQEIAHERDTDGLTGLWNKNAIVKKISGLVCDKNTAGAFFIMDIDHFKQINDTCGHKFGDEVLAAASGYIQKIFVDGDIAGRFGGDEFIFYMKHADLDKASETAEKLIRTLYNGIPVPIEDKGIRTSIGIALYKGTPGVDYDSLMIMADKALYITKKNGRFGYTVFSEEQMERHSVAVS